MWGLVHAWHRRIEELEAEVRSLRATRDEYYRLVQARLLEDLKRGSLPPFVATHRHRKGALYRLLGEVMNTTTLEVMVLYDNEFGTMWVRPKVEFEDGRFQLLPLEKED